MKNVEPEVAEKPVGFVRGFREFLGQYGIIPLAVAVVIGGSVNNFINSIVTNLITPLVAIIAPEGKIQNISFFIKGSEFKVGLVINAAISFLVVAWLVYLTAMLVLRNDDLLKKK